MSVTALAFLVVYFVMLMLAFVRDPVWGLYAYLWVFYNHPPARWWGQELPDFRLSLVAALLTLFAMLLRPEPTKRDRSRS